MGEPRETAGEQGRGGEGAGPAEGRVWALTPKQRRFVGSRAKFPCMAGGFGSGKTVALCVRAVMWAQAYPGSVGLVGRLTYQELKDTTGKTLLEVLPAWAVQKEYGGSYRRNEGYVQLPNKSEILLRHLDTVSEMELRSLNLTWFAIDQAEEISEEVFLALCGRLRHQVGVRSGWITCNPAMNWIYRHWKAFPDPDTELVEVKTYENPYLPEGYLETMVARYPKEWIARYIEGEWTAFEGQIFPEFSEREHVKGIIPEEEWPPDVEMLCGIDHGLRNPTAAVWAMVDWGGRLWVFQEYEQEGLLVSQNVARIRHLSGTRKVAYVIDPSTHAREPLTGKRVIDEYADSFGERVWLEEGNNDVAAGLARLGELFHQKALFVSPACPKLIAALQEYRWAPQRFAVQNQGMSQDEKPWKQNDHLVDALRYLVMTRPAPPRRPDPRPPNGSLAWWLGRRTRERLSESLVGREHTHERPIRSWPQEEHAAW